MRPDPAGRRQPTPVGLRAWLEMLVFSLFVVIAIVGILATFAAGVLLKAWSRVAKAFRKGGS